MNVNGSAESVRKAKASVEKRSGVTGRWTRTAASNGRVALYVLTDKQPVGYVLADHTRDLVRAFDSEMRHISTFQVQGHGKIVSVSRAPRKKAGVDLLVRIRRKCASWEQDHGKINDKNFIQCLAAVMESCGSDAFTIENATKIILEIGSIKHCSCCGSVPAYEKDINGESIELCSECQSLVLFQQLGPGEGYV